MRCPGVESLAVLFALSTFGCEKADQANEPVEVPVDEGSKEPEAAEVELPTDSQICEHIVDLSHLALGHSDEMRAEEEAEALAECVGRVVADRKAYGVAFAVIPECTFAAEALAGVAACEDHFARDLVGGDADKAIGELSLEEPIVDRELCMHWAHVATGKAVETTECRGELIRIRKHVGNVAFDSFAGCMMDSKDEAEFFDCAHKADALAPADRGAPKGPAPQTTPEQALAALAEIADAACACTSRECAHEARDSLDGWTEHYRGAGGTDAQAHDAERLVVRFVRCEVEQGGPGWVND